MPYCPDCAVELETGLGDCPLCGAAPQEERPEVRGSYPERDQAAAPVVRTPWPVVRRRIFYAASALTVVGLVSSVIVDVGQSLPLEWSPMVIVSGLAGWAVMKWLLFEWNRPLRLVPRLLALSAVLVLSLDACDGRFDWSLDPALPVVGLVALVFGPLLMAIFRFRVSWASSTAWTLLCGGLFCLGLEWWMDFRNPEDAGLSWSLPVMLAIFPAALSMFFVRYHLMRRVNFEKLFHR